MKTSPVQAVHNIVKNQSDKVSKDILVKAQSNSKNIGFGRDAIKISISQAVIDLKNK